MMMLGANAKHTPPRLPLGHRAESKESEESQAPSAVAGKAQEQINSNNQIKNIYDYEK